jgi:hypothetical protein
MNVNYLVWVLHLFLKPLLCWAALSNDRRLGKSAVKEPENACYTNSPMA